MNSSQSEGKKDTLRRRAQKSLLEKPKDLGGVSYTDIQNVIHELKVHQVELEIQNEEFSRVQLELEKSRNKYADLYDFAPVGYFTLDEKGIILESNLTGSALLGVERKSLIRRTLSRYVVKESHNLFYSYRKRLLETTSRQACELRMLWNSLAHHR